MPPQRSNSIMPPTRARAPSIAWNKFNKDLQMHRHDRGPVAAPGSGSDKGDHLSSRDQIVETSKYVKARTIGRSVFSNLALGFKIDGRDPNSGMRLEVMELARRQESQRRVKDEIKMKEEDAKPVVAERGRNVKASSAAKRHRVEIDGDVEDVSDTWAERTLHELEKRRSWTAGEDLKVAKKTRARKRVRIVESDEEEGDEVGEGLSAGKSGGKSKGRNGVDKDAADRIRVPSRRLQK